MVDGRPPDSLASDGIRAAVTQGEYLRRRRRVTRLLSRVVPAVAAGVLLSAAGVWFTHAPLALFWMLCATAVVGVLVLTWLTGRLPAVTDAVAAQMDADAGLGGELRSAHWFVLHPGTDNWTTYHLEGAAERVRLVSWPAVYPPVPAGRAWALSTALAIAAIALVMTKAWPRAGGWVTTGGARIVASAPERTGQVISADLQKQINELLRSIGKDAVPMDSARARVDDLRDALANAAQGQARKAGNTDPKADAKMADLASRAEQAATDAALPEDVKWSLQDLAAKLAQANRPPADANAKANPDSKAPGAAGSKPAQPGQAPQTISGQETRVTTADAQSNQMMTSDAGPLGGDPMGRGGEAGRRGGVARPIDLAGALRKEAVEASADATGANVLAEMRRKSEQSRSALQFSHVAPLAAYDTSHASAPPPPPDSLRPLVQQYFIRR